MDAEEETFVICGPAWGFMENGAFVRLPRIPFMQAGMNGPCPFVVTLPDGRRRTIIEDPSA